MDVSSLRARTHATNLANQNTPGYRSKAVDFDEEFQRAFAAGDDVTKIEARLYEPRDSSVGADGNDVESHREVLQSAENASLYNTYIALARGRHQLTRTAISPAP